MIRLVISVIQADFAAETKAKAPKATRNIQFNDAM